MDSHNERMARYRAKFEEDEARLQRALAEPGATSSKKSTFTGHLREIALIVAALAVSLVLVGGSMSIIGLGGRDFGDAQRIGLASVGYCGEHGPVTNRGFGYWERCTVTIRWDDGTTTRAVDDGTFTSADIDQEVTVGYLGTRRHSLQLARADTAYRPWFTWIGVGIGLIAAVPGIFAVMALQAYVGGIFRDRKRRSAR